MLCPEPHVYYVEGLARLRGAWNCRAMEIIRQSRARQLVRELYRAILGREPDPEGARAYENLIRKLGADRALPKAIKAIMRSEEYRRRADAMAVSHVNSILASHGENRLNGLPVNHLVSLGSFCLPALLFRNNGLRRYSLPFDWIFSTPQMVRDCLGDDFTVFLDRAHYRSVDAPGRDAAAEHEVYREKYGLPALFAHRDPTRDSDYLYFVRCVTRFRRLLQSNDAKVFMLIGRANHDLVKEFPLMIESLERVTKNFVLLCVELLDPTAPALTSLLPVARISAHELLRFTPSSYNAVGGFLPDKLDEWTLLRLIYRYELSLRDSAWDRVSSEPEADSEAAGEQQHPQEALP